jgi:hypothetical protein
MQARGLNDVGLTLDFVERAMTWIADWTPNLPDPVLNEKAVGRELEIEDITEAEYVMAYAICMAKDPSVGRAIGNLAQFGPAALAAHVERELIGDLVECFCPQFPKDDDGRPLWLLELKRRLDPKNVWKDVVGESAESWQLPATFIWHVFSAFVDDYEGLHCGVPIKARMRRFRLNVTPRSLNRMLCIICSAEEHGWNVKRITYETADPNRQDKSIVAIELIN